jgi:hypothetical protein
VSAASAHVGTGALAHSGSVRAQVRRPDVALRVSDHMRDIVEYVRQLIRNGYAYETQVGRAAHWTGACLDEERAACAGERVL